MEKDFERLLKQLVDQGKQIVDQGKQNQIQNTFQSEKISNIIDDIQEIKDKFIDLENKIINSGSDLTSLRTITSSSSQDKETNNDDIKLTIEDFENDLHEASLKWEAQRIKLFPLNENLRLQFFFTLKY